MATTVLKRVGSPVSAGQEKRVGPSPSVGGASFDPWGGSWGSAWGSSWLVSESTRNTARVSQAPSSETEKRVGSLVDLIANKRVAASPSVGGATFDPWDGSWGSGWGASWLVSAEARNTARVQQSPSQSAAKRVGSVIDISALRTKRVGPSPSVGGTTLSRVVEHPAAVATKRVGDITTDVETGELALEGDESGLMLLEGDEIGTLLLEGDEAFLSVTILDPHTRRLSGAITSSITKRVGAVA